MALHETGDVCMRGQLTAYLGSMKGSLTATIWMSSCSMALRKTMRPIRPKPLMPTLTTILTVVMKTGKYQERCEASCWKVANAS